MRRRPSVMRWIFAAAAAVGACTDEPPPTAPEADPAAPPAGGARQTPPGGTVFSDRAYAMLGEEFELLSDAAELEVGRYRFRAATGGGPAVARDDFIVVETGDGAEVRRVLERREEGGALILETGHAYWHEIVNGGTYAITVPFDGEEASLLAPGPQAAPIQLDAETLQLPVLERQLAATDVCAWIDSLVATEGESAVCGKEVNLEVGTGWRVGINGTLDSLRILSGSVRLSGEMDVELTVDPGGISGGRAPRLAPCDRGFFLGCLTTPTGAALIEFLRRYLPSIPEASLPPLRLCIPGTWVRVQRGYWSGFIWNPPVWERCEVVDIGELPTVTLPSVPSASAAIRPRVQAEVSVRAKGDGGFTLKLPIPSAAASVAYGTNRLSVKASLGAFMLVQADLENAGATVAFTFDDTGLLAHDWSPSGGWTGGFEVLEKSHTAQVLDAGPDSLAVRLGMPLEARMQICIALAGCPTGPDSAKTLLPKSPQDLILSLLKIRLYKGVGVSMFQDVTWSRDQVHPTDPEVDNFHISIEGAYDLSVENGLSLPIVGWLLPSSPLEHQQTWECCRVPIADYWGQGNLVVTTATTGANLDADGYTVLVERVNETPHVYDPGVQELLSPWKPERREAQVGINGTADFGGTYTAAPCVALYSDRLVYGSPIFGLWFAGARSLGIDIPTYAITGPCPFLIARYRVSLAGVSPECSVAGGPVRGDVWLQQLDLSKGRSNTKTVHFDVDCDTPAAPGTVGALRVTIPTLSGVTKTGEPYEYEERPYLLVDGSYAGEFPANDTLLVEGLSPGPHEIDVERTAPLCGPPATTVDVIADVVTYHDLAWVCIQSPASPGDVTFETTLEGSGTDPNGYRIVVDGVAAAALPVDGEATVPAIPGATPTVFHVADISGACQPLGPNPQVVTLDVSATPDTVPVVVRCIDTKPDTLVGAVDAITWPLPTVTIRASDGRTLQVSGPLTGELARLSGSTVRAWGGASATGIDVHGYDLPSELGDDRWLGIVLTRPSGTWLIGEEAIPLVDVPAALLSVSGSLVWVSGREVVGGVQPVLFGVVRGP